MAENRFGCLGGPPGRIIEDQPGEHDKRDGAVLFALHQDADCRRIRARMHR